MQRNDAPGAPRRIPVADLRAFSNNCLKSMGVPPDDAEVVTDCLLFADLRGHASHGMVRLPVYGKRILAKVVNAQARPHTERSFGAVSVVDGDNGLGPVVGAHAMDCAIERAGSHGIGMVVARRSNHFGSAAFYTERAARARCIGLAASNAPPNMAPWGGRERFLGTNPLSIAVPAGKRAPIVLDMATSVVARGQIILAAQRGDSIPPGWALDPDGNPTTDAALALLGSVLPFGGPKGSAISLLIDVFSGVLSGAAYGRHLNTLEDQNSVQNLGHWFVAIRIDSFMAEDEFGRRVDDLLGQLKKTPRAPGVQEILAPGELELTKLESTLDAGIPVSEDVAAGLSELAETLGVTHPWQT